MRPALDQYFMQMARLVATRSTCLRRQVGCVLVSERGHVLATGYNGVAAGKPHCNHEQVELVRDDLTGRDELVRVYPHACSGASAATGQDLDQCDAVHAEQNALLQCHDPREVATAYVTVSPCVSCAKLFLNTGCSRVVYGEPYQGHLEAVEALYRGTRLAIVHLEAGPK